MHDTNISQLGMGFGSFAAGKCLLVTKNHVAFLRAFRVRGGMGASCM